MTENEPAPPPEPEPSGLRLWAGILLEITIAVIMLPVALIAGAVHLGTRMVRRLCGRAERDEDTTEPQP